jgi:predicted hydrocarbon binding protein
MNAAGRNFDWDPVAGRLHFEGLRHLLVRPETLAELQKGVEDRLGNKAAEFLYAAGAAWSVGAVRRLAKGAEPVELARAVCAQATSMGWGLWTVQAFDPGARRLAVEIQGSPFAEAYGSADHPVCHLACGAVAGLAESLLAMPAGCTERSCVAMGHGSCIFLAEGQDLAGRDSWGW